MSKRCKFQLYEQGASSGGGKAIESSGGVVYVAQNGSAAKRTITDVDGAALTNPRALTNGSVEFYVADSVEKVDLYIQCPDGEFLVVKDAEVEQIDDLYVDKGAKLHEWVIPFDEDHQAGDATETNSGFDLPANAMVLPHAAIRVQTVDASETIDVGLLSSETAGDADGFLAAVSVATAGMAKGTLASAGQTLGALLRVDESGGGVLVPEGHVVTGSNATSITWTLSAGSDTAKGFIHLPVVLMNN